MQSETSKTKKQNIDFEVANFALLPIKELENNDIEPTFSNEAILSKEEKWGIFLLHLLYFVQGIPFGFFGLAIPYLLIEKGADFTQIGILSFCLYPFCFKIFLAPFEDIYFFRNFGKRKTYIIPCQYLLAFFFLILSFIINGLLEDLNVGVLCFLGFLIVLIIAFQDVSVDGWVLTLLSNENVKWGAVSQCVGQAIGIIFGGSILIQLSSVKFCNEYLFSEPSNSPLITIPNFLRIFAIIILLINFWVHFGIKERNPAKNEYLSVWILVKDLKGFYTNANLRYCVILCLTSNLGFAAVTNTAPLKLIQLGFSKETLTTISMTLILVNLGLSFIIGKYARIGNEMSLYIRFYVILFVHNIFLFILISVYDGTQGGSFTFLYVISALFGDGTAALVMVNQGSFNNRISDEDVGGTFLTFLNAMWNFGRFGGTSLILFLVDSFNYTVLVILSWVYVIVYMAVFEMDQKNNFISERKESQKLIQNEPPQTKLQNFDLIINSTTPLLNEDLSVDPTLTPQEKRGVFLLHSLYFIQGIPLGLFGFSASVIILLTEAGADFSDLGVLSFCMYPFAFKMLFAPIEDTYFSPRFGKRKSYIIPLQYILAALFFISSFIIEDLILSKSIGTIFLVGFVMVWIASLQDIAVDGWNLTILQNHNLGWGSVAQSVGQQVGVVLGSTVLIIFSSTKFCNDYLYSEPSTTPLISINSFFKIFVIIIIVINVYVHFFVKERNPVSNDEFPTVWALVKHLKGFYYNKNLKFYMFMMMTWKLGFFTVSATFPLKLIQQGFPKETIASVMTCLIPVNFVASFLTGKYVKIGTEFTYYFKIYALHLVNDVISFILVNNYNNISSGVFLLFFIIVCFIHYSVITAMFVIQGQFNNRISDEDVGGSYLTFLNSINNLGKMGANSLVFFLVGAFNYGVIVFCSWIFTICYLINFGKQIRDLEKIEKKDWKLS